MTFIIVLIIVAVLAFSLLVLTIPWLKAACRLRKLGVDRCAAQTP